MNGTTWPPIDYMDYVRDVSALAVNGQSPAWSYDDWKRIPSEAIAAIRAGEFSELTVIGDHSRRRIEFKDVDVIPRDLLDKDEQRNFQKPWIVQFANGKIRQYETEDEACALQRNWRSIWGRDPMTGEALS